MAHAHALPAFNDPEERPGTLTVREEDEIRARLNASWREGSGLWAWLTSTNHKSISKRYIVTALVFFVLGGIEAGMIRAQLARPENRLIGPDLYNQIFTMHGSTMMFLFAVPVMEAIGLYLVPLMIGTRNVAFPRLNALGYWMYLFGGVLLYVAFFCNTGPDAGWFAYVPLSGPEYSPGKRIDIWAQMITFTEIAALIGAVEIITTVLKQRAPGMSLNRIPLFVWAMLITSFMIIFALPAIVVSSSMLAMDRLIDTHFFNPAEGGDALLWQHLFWFFGHPEVYIIVIPALGMLSSIIETFTRQRIFGYPAMVLSLITTAFLGFGLWVHHMFATPLPQLGQSLFTAASAAIAIPTGVQIFCWIATIWSGRPRYTTSFMFVIGFFVLFIVGGMSGVMIASIPYDLQVHDTFFVVAHFHYVLLGGAVFPLFGAFYYWFPKMTGRLLSERAGKWNFWLFFVGMNVTFFPMHLLGLIGMPRRVYTYLPEMGWGNLNLLSSVGAVIIAASVCVFLSNVWVSLRRGVPAGDNPWEASTLEWATSSPPPAYNHLFIPVVQGRDPLWDASGGELAVVTGLRTDRHEGLLTSVMDAEPEHRFEFKGPTILPLLLAVFGGGSIVLAIFTPWGVTVGSVFSLVILACWFWPTISPDYDTPRKR
ncbi:MAG TPA: cytochrome c oxidase subunit I [Gemmatimonadaceae bacterium]|jgi:cytochrome c oxidase subunit 1|nr:cytochrome c oxidase subunit I [Gemmatimonadaceae bacterium]